jgi:hypothetical protein
MGKSIGDLSLLTAAQLEAAADRLILWDNSASTNRTKAILLEDLKSAIAPTPNQLGVDLSVSQVGLTDKVAIWNQSSSSLKSTTLSTIGQLANTNCIAQSKTVSSIVTTSTVVTNYATTGISIALSNNLKSTNSLVRLRFLVPTATVVLGFFKIFRGALDLTPAGATCMAVAPAGVNSGVIHPVTVEALDAPGTIVPATYTLWWASSAGANAVWIGRRVSDTTIIVPTVVTIEEILQ